MPKVTLISHTPEPEKTIAAAAKLCYSPATLDNLMSGITEEKAESFVQMLSEIGHESPIEHATFTFGIEGVSRAFLAQITRHRIASYSVQSQRYVSENNFEYVIPPEIDGIEEAKELYLKAMETANNYYNNLTELLKNKHKQDLIEKGIDEKTADRQATKIAIEDARFVLPNACDTKMIVTMNARSLLNFFKHRCCNRAQWEIREVAEKMLALVLQVAPSIFATAGPSCVRGNCPEGKMSCGKINEVREKYTKIREHNNAR